MSAIVIGPDDLNPGDVVEVRDPRTGRVSGGTVTKVGPERASVRFENGRARSIAYVKTWRTSNQIINQTHRSHVMRKLSPRDLWQLEQPTSTLASEFWSRMKRAVRDGTVCVVHLEIDSIAAWLAKEPP